MSQVAFIAAMAADIAFGRYEKPTEIEDTRSEWIIVHRWGATSEFLSLSLTRTIVTDPSSAPPGLQPVATYLGLQLACSDIGGRAEAEYLLVRQQPRDVMLGGIFYPSDGHVRVIIEDGAIRLSAHGRYAHCSGVSQGTPVVRDIPCPAPGYESARAWHLSAVQRPWIGEFIGEDVTAAPRAERIPTVAG